MSGLANLARLILVAIALVSIGFSLLAGLEGDMIELAWGQVVFLVCASILVLLPRGRK